MHVLAPGAGAHGWGQIIFPILVTRDMTNPGAAQPGKKAWSMMNVALVWGMQNPKVQISGTLNRLQLEDNVPFYVEFTATDIAIPITMFSVRNDTH